MESLEILAWENGAQASWSNSSQRHRQRLPPGGWWVSTSCTPFLSNNHLKMLPSEALFSFTGATRLLAKTHDFTLSSQGRL